MERVGSEAKKTVTKTEKEYVRLTGDLKRQASAAQKELNSLVHKGEDAFRDLKKGVFASANEVEAAIKKAFRRFTG